MNAFKVIYLTFCQMVEEIRLLPKTIAAAAENRRAQIIRADDEAERLDRIRNPSKYRGK